MLPIYALAGRGIFNCLISNGRWLFAYAGTRLHWLTRRAPFRTATLADDDLSVDFAQLAGPQDVVSIISTEPLTTDESWSRLQVGEAVLLQRGEVLLHHLSDIAVDPPAEPLAVGAAPAAASLSLKAHPFANPPTPGPVA